MSFSMRTMDLNSLFVLSASTFLSCRRLNRHSSPFIISRNCLTSNSPVTPRCFPHSVMRSKSSSVM